MRDPYGQLPRRLDPPATRGASDGADVLNVADVNEAELVRRLGDLLHKAPCALLVTEGDGVA